MRGSGGSAPSRRRPMGIWGKPPAADGWAKPSATGGNGVWGRIPLRSAIFITVQQK